MSVTLTVNGNEVSRLIEPRLTLADLLRDQVGLTGTKLGCEHGVCGACTVIVDGDAVRSCLIFAVQAERRSVTTVEALAADGMLNDLQSAFQRHHALQCGFCTAGMLMAATALLSRGTVHDRDAIRAALAGNLCRCTGYEPCIDAVVEVASRIAPTAP